MKAELRNPGPRCVRGSSAAVVPVPAVPAAVQFALPLTVEDELPHAQEFERWRATMGGNWVLEQVFKRVDGYTMNNNFHAHAERLVMARRPQWKGMFEERELQRPRKAVSETTITVRKFA